MKDNIEIIYEIFTPEHLEQATKLLISCFSGRDYSGKPFPDNVFREPMCEILSYDSVIEYMTEMNKKWSTNGLGLIAKDNQTQEVVGVVTAEDFLDQEDISPELNIIFNKDDFKHSALFLEDIDEPILKMNPKRGEVAHMIFFGVKLNSVYETLKLGSSLCNNHFNLAKQKGFKYYCAECTGNASQHIFEKKFGFENKKEINYEEWKSPISGEFIWKKNLASVKSNPTNA